MNASKHTTGARRTRANARLSLAPMTRAVRAALVASAAMLALSAPGEGTAGTCSYDAVRNAYICNGDFAQAVPDGLFVPPVDLILVLGNELPTSVTPAAGTIGVDAAWAGDVSVIAYAGTFIGTDAADGIHVYSADGAAMVANYGSIATDATAYSANALDASAIDDVTVVNGGDVSAAATSGYSNVVAAVVSSGSGDIGIDNLADGSITASAFNGNATALAVEGNYAIDIGNDGLINADSVYGNATGIRAYGAEVSIQNGGTVHAGGDRSAAAISAYGKYAVVDNSGTIEAVADADGGHYVGAIGVRVAAYDAVVHNAAGGLIDASNAATDDGAWARARGVYATGFFDGVTVENEGSIQAHARSDDGRANAEGIYAFGYGSPTTVTNAGDIRASAASATGGAYATGINAIGYGSGANDSEVVNTGSILAEADAAYAYAFGVLNLTRQRYGSAYLANEGAIHAEATGNYATATGSLNLALRYGDAMTTNTGTVDAVANGTSAGTATGLYNYALVYDAILDNSGAVSATATGDLAIGVGIYNHAVIYGSATTVNSGDVDAHAHGDALQARAAGVVSTAEVGSDLTNDGNVDVTAYSVDGAATATGLYALSYELSTVRNYGDVSASAQSANGDASAYGAFAFGGFSGIGLLINGGDLHAEASAGDGGRAYAVGGMVVADVASIFNDVAMGATATAGEGGTALATAARTYGLNSAIYSYGDLSAEAAADGGLAQAIGAHNFGYTSGSFYNAGGITASATADGGLAAAYGAYSVGVYYAYAGNVGTIAAGATGDQAVAMGLANLSYLDAITVNDGSIDAVAEGGLAAYGEYEAVAFGVYNLATVYNSIVDNRGSITATASVATDISGTDGFLVAKAIGALALSGYGYGETAVVNSGGIGATAETSQGYAGAWGAVAQTGYLGYALVQNDGTISSYAHTGVGSADTIGAYVSSIAGTSTIVNHGDISATSRAERGIVYVAVDYAVATGVRALSAAYGGGEATVSNYGGIRSHASVQGGIAQSTAALAAGMYTTVDNAAGADITATAESELFGGAFSMGVHAGDSGSHDVAVTNDGGITAYSLAHAYSVGTHGYYGAAGAVGIYAMANFYGDVAVANNGGIAAIAIAEDSVTFFQGGAGATGIDTYAKYDAHVVNAGDITALADTELGISGAYGVIGHGKYSTEIINQAGASILASASAGSLYSDQYAGRAVSFGTQIFGRGMEHASTYNAGSIVSHAVVTADGGANEGRSIATAFGSSTGYNSPISVGTVANVGSIEAAASADFGYASAYAIFLRTDYDSSLANAGDVRASASAENGDAFAVGSYAYALHQTVSYNCGYQEGAYGQYYTCDWANPIRVVDGGVSSIANDGDILATASAMGGVGRSYGAVALGAFEAGITNAGHITAVTEGDDALAVGALVNSFYGEATLQNGGAIGAVATGTVAAATGAYLLGAAGVQVDNAGTIAAAAHGNDATAIAVSMQSNGSNVLNNTGTIGAFGDGTRIAISSNADATAVIANSGSLTGAIVTGNLDDSFENAAGGTWVAVGESDFGAGDDAVVNLGTIFMDDAAILMGADVPAATPASIAAFAVPGARTFDNAGTLFVSGAGNVIDTGGSFYNNGVISFVDGAPDDVLAVTGDFSGDGVINLDVSGLNQASDQLYVDGSIIEPTTQTLNVNLLDLPTVPGMDVTMITTSGTLVGDFVLGNVQLSRDGFVTMDFGLNVSADTVSLGVDVTGLNGTGSLAAAVAPGVQSLANAQVGTYRQRMGLVPEAGGAGLAPWMRAFTESGDVDARHGANFGAGGSLGFHQSNHGWEVGLEARPTEHAAVGVLVADSEGSQRLDGAGNSRFDGKTFGLYGTWFGARDAYVDVSHRWTGIDVRLHSATGTYTTHASAQTFNVEGGFTAWTSAGGLNVVPQVQYTSTRVSDIDTLQAGQSAFANDGGFSRRGRAGMAFDKEFQGAGFVWTPYGSINAVRESGGGFDHAIDGGLQGTTRTDGTSAMVELGLGARKDRLSVTGGLNWSDGGALDSVIGAQLVLRYNW